MEIVIPESPISISLDGMVNERGQIMQAKQRGGEYEFSSVKDAESKISNNGGDKPSNAGK